jgi:hypothetical protein
MSEPFDYEKAVETAEARRDFLREECASCNNCSELGQQPHYEHCYMFQVRPELNVCYHWRRKVEQEKA